METVLPGVKTRFAGWSVFAAGFALYVVLQSCVMFLPMRVRSAPIETDDSYEYLLKTVEMVTCFRQECQALTDLRSQLDVPSTDPAMAWLRHREYKRVFLVYHPLFSALVAGVHTIGLSVEKAYEVIQLAGAVFVWAAIAYWLVALWTPGPAGVALAMLAFMVFPDNGLLFITPSSVTLGIAIFVWARISALEDRAGRALVLGTLAMVAMHPMGRLYAIASIALFVLAATSERWTKKRIVVVLVASLIVAVTFVLPVVVHRPELAIRPDPPLADWPRSWHGSVGHGLAANWRVIHGILSGWTALYGSVAQAVILTAFGAVTLPRARRSTVVRNGLVLGAVLVVSAVHILPGYPAEVFTRVWIPMAVLLTGATGQVAWTFFLAACSYFDNDRRRGVSPVAGVGSGLSALVATPNWLWTLTTAVGIFVAVRMGIGMLQGLRDGEAAFVAMRDEQRWLLDPVQPKLMLSQARISDAVLYLDEVPMHFYLTHGALKLRALYYPAVVNPSYGIFLSPWRPIDSPRIYQTVAAETLPGMQRHDFENAQYLVGWSPVQRHPKSREAMIPVSAYRNIEYSSPARVALRNFRGYLVNPGSEAVLELAYRSQNTPRTVRATVPAGWSDWLSLPDQVSNDMVSVFNLTIKGAVEEVYMKGLRFGETDLSWPWEQRASLLFQTGDGEDRTIRFDPDELLPLSGWHVSVTVLNDSGSIVLSKLVH